MKLLKMLAFLSLIPLLSPLNALATKTDKTLKVGALLCLSGVCAETGSNSLRGLELAAEQINKSGGILGRQIVLNVEDTKESSFKHQIQGSLW